MRTYKLQKMTIFEELSETKETATKQTGNITDNIKYRSKITNNGTLLMDKKKK